MRGAFEADASLEPFSDYLDDAFSYIRQAYENQRSVENGGVAKLPLLDRAHFKAELLETITNYLAAPQYHTARRTDLLCTALLDIEAQTLRRVMRDPGELITEFVGYLDAYRLADFRKSTGVYAWVTWIVAILSALFGLFVMILSVWVGLLFVGAAIWTLVSRSIRKRKVEAGMREMQFEIRKMYSSVLYIRNEIETSSYDVPTVVARIRELEGKGIGVPSIIYTLLNSRTPAAMNR